MNIFKKEPTQDDDIPHNQYTNMYLGYKFENYEKVIGMRIGCTILGMCVVPFR